MDIDVAGWILEFVLRQKSVDVRTLNELILALPLPDHNLTLKKSLILRQIESSISKGGVSENILELLEVIEELDRMEGIMEVSEAMKAAYCGVATHCTLRVLLEGKDNGGYGDAMKSIWKGRARKMETLFEISAADVSGTALVSNELRTWMDDIKSGVWEKSVCENASMGKYNRRREVVEVVRGYVAEAKEKIGPSFIELAAEKLSADAMKEVMGLPKGNRERHRGGGRSENSSLIMSLLKRRPRKSWSIEEENALWLGVNKYGKGNWKLILNMYPDMFVGRSTVDLKDKWRNMSRYESSYLESKNTA